MNRLKIGFILLVLMSPVVLIKECQAQKTAIGAGITYSSLKEGEVKDFIDPLGFYVEALIKEQITDHLKVSGSLGFMNQKSKLNDLKYQVNSINAGFLFRVYPFTTGLNVLAGFNIGLKASATIDSEDIPSLDKGNAQGVIGLSYEVDRFEFVTRYNKQLNREIFDNTIQFGFAYQLNQ